MIKNIRSINTYVWEIEFTKWLRKEFQSMEGCVDQIFTIKQIVEKYGKKKWSVGGFYGLGKAYDRVSMETLWRC